jgi:hypothetical protein
LDPTSAPLWSGLRPTGARDLLENAPRPWWICGGWAIELFADGPQRDHEDIDVGCLRLHVDELLRSLDGWEHFTAAKGRLTPHDPVHAVAVDTTSLWCRRRGSDRWDVQIMIEESVAGSWVYRRDDRIRRPLPDLTWTSSTGVAVLEPEIQLLYKAKGARPKDEQDFAAALPEMSTEARRWLASALQLTTPGHPWLGRLVA